MKEQAPSKFSNSGEVQQLTEYRRFNLLAIFAAVLGVLSVGVLVSPFLFILPLLAIFLGACGLGLHYRRDDLGGRVPAWVGIALAMFFMSWAASQFCFSRCVYYSEAHGVVNEWVDLVVKGELEIAHQAMMSVTRRQANSLSVDEYYAMDEEVAKQRDEVFAEPPLCDLVKMGEDTDVKLIKNVSLVHDLDSSLMEQVYRVSPANGDPMDLKINTLRRFNKTAEKASWIISGAEISDEPSPNIAEQISCFVTNLMAR